MLILEIGNEEYFDEESSEFKAIGGYTLELEHSLVSLSKWESIFEKPFLGGTQLSVEELEAYIECMILTPEFPPGVVAEMQPDHIEQIYKYIEKSHTATKFGAMPKNKIQNEVITSELIYYWLVAFQIPFECETWHLNRLFALIQICNSKSQPPKKLSKAEHARRAHEINERRKRELGTSG